MSDRTVVLVDDHPIFRRGMRDIIDETDGFRVIAEAEDGDAAVKCIGDFKPTFAILDLAMPERDGFEVTVWAAEHCPETACVIITMYTEIEYLERAVALGALGFLAKDDTQAELIRCLDVVADGDFYVSALVGKTRQPAPEIDRLPDDSAEIRRLTPAQREVLKLLSQYKTSKEIGRVLNISHKTVENHRLNISTELDLQGRNMLLRFAVRNGHLL